jgi:hypothetical protein
MSTKAFKMRSTSFYLFFDYYFCIQAANAASAADAASGLYMSAPMDLQ